MTVCVSIFDQVDNHFDTREPPPKGRKGPFYAQDYSRLQSNPGKRARRIAKPEWEDPDSGRGVKEFNDLLEEELRLNATIDFSFHTKYKAKGNWNNYKIYEVEVSNVKREEIPEKQQMYESPKVEVKPMTVSLSDIKNRRKAAFPL